MRSLLWLSLALLGILMSSCSRSQYTPAVFPSPDKDPKKEIRGPVFYSFEEAQAWAITQIRRTYPEALYIVYKDLYWNKEYGMEMARERLK